MHTFFGVTALGLGTLAVISLRPDDRPAVGWYLGSVWAMAAALVADVAYDWPVLDITTKSVFAALVVLALYMCWRGWRALRALREQGDDWHQTFIEDVGFTLITLFDGFVIVGVLDLGTPVWLVVLVGVLGVAAGRLAINQAKLRVLSH